MEITTENKDFKWSLDDEELASIVRQDLDQAKNYADESSSWRQQLYNEYHAKPYGNEKEGRSKFVSTDLMNSIQWIMPSLMRVFAGTQFPVKLDSTTDKTEERSRLANSRIQYQLLRKNKYFKVVYNWFMNALRFRTSVIKRTWMENFNEIEEVYENVTLGDYQELNQNPNIDIIDVEFSQLGQMYMAGEIPLLDVTDIFVRSIKIKIHEVLYEGTVLENVKPEMFMITPDWDDIDLEGCPFVAHKIRMSESELNKRSKANFFKKGRVEEAIDMGKEKSTPREDEDVQRQEVLGFSADTPESKQDTRTKYDVYECYIDVDVNNDGINEKIIVWLLNDTVLRRVKNEYGEPPFSAISPILEPHSFFGISLAEMIRDIQKIKTSLVRLMLDNMSFQVNGRFQGLQGKFNMSDLLHNNVPGGIVRVSAMDAVKPLEQPRLPNYSFNMLEYVETLMENRSGVTRYSQGLDAQSLNKTATGVQTIVNQAMQRIELIARIFAETGFTDLIRGMIKNDQTFMTQEQAIRIQGEPTMVYPEDMDGEFDLIVNVGIGNINTQQMASNLIMGIQLTVQLYGMTDPEKINNMLSKWWEINGFKNPEQYVPEINNVKQQQQLAMLSQLQGGQGNGQAQGFEGGNTVGRGSEVPSNPSQFPESIEGAQGALNTTVF